MKTAIWRIEEVSFLENLFMLTAEGANLGVTLQSLFGDQR